MAHLRKRIRDAVVTALTGLASTGPRVYPTRVYPIQPGALPALCVYTLSEASEVHSMGPDRALLRQLDLVVQAVAKVNDTLDDTLDQICLEVEGAIGTAPTLGGLCYDCTLASTRITVEGEGEKETGSAVMVFSLRYRSRAADPSINAI